MFKLSRRKREPPSSGVFCNRWSGLDVYLGHHAPRVQQKSEKEGRIRRWRAEFADVHIFFHYKTHHTNPYVHAEGMHLLDINFRWLMKIQSVQKIRFPGLLEKLRHCDGNLVASTRATAKNRLSSGVLFQVSTGQKHMSGLFWVVGAGTWGFASPPNWSCIRPNLTFSSKHTSALFLLRPQRVAVRE